MYHAPISWLYKPAFEHVSQGLGGRQGFVDAAKPENLLAGIIRRRFDRRTPLGTERSHHQIARACRDVEVAKLRIESDVNDTFVVFDPHDPIVSVLPRTNRARPNPRTESRQPTVGWSSNNHFINLMFSVNPAATGRPTRSTSARAR